MPLYHVMLAAVGNILWLGSIAKGTRSCICMTTLNNFTLYFIVLYCKFASKTIKAKALSRFRGHANAPQFYFIPTLTDLFVSLYVCKSNKRAKLPFFNYLL
jgi:hypothetical protein